MSRPDASPPARAPEPRSPLRHLPWLLALCVGLGAAGVIFGLSAVLARDEPLELAPLAVPEAPEGEEAEWAPVAEAFERIPQIQLDVLRRHRPAITALAAVDVIASAVLLFGALLARRRTGGALRILLAGLVLSQAYAVLKLGIQTWVQVDLYRALLPVVDALSARGEVGTATATVTMLAQSATLVLMAAVALAELGFYLWAHRFLKKPVVHAFLTQGPEA